MVHVVAGLNVPWRVVDRPFGNPARDQLDLTGRQRRLVLGHLGLAVLVGRDLLDEMAFRRFARNNRPVIALAPLDQVVERRHHVAAAGLRGLMAALTAGLEYRANLLVVTDLEPGTRAGLVLFRLVGRKKRRRSDQQGHENRHPATPIHPGHSHLGRLPDIA